MATTYKLRPQTVQAVTFDGTQASAAAVKAIDPANVQTAPAGEDRTQGGEWPDVPVAVRLTGGRFASLPAGAVAVATDAGVIAMRADEFTARYEPA